MGKAIAVIVFIVVAALLVGFQVGLSTQDSEQRAIGIYPGLENVTYFQSSHACDKLESSNAVSPHVVCLEAEDFSKSKGTTVLEKKQYEQLRESLCSSVYWKDAAACNFDTGDMEQWKRWFHFKLRPDSAPQPELQ